MVETIKLQLKTLKTTVKQIKTLHVNGKTTFYSSFLAYTSCQNQTLTIYSWLETISLLKQLIAIQIITFECKNNYLFLIYSLVATPERN